MKLEFTLDIPESALNGCTEAEFQQSVKEQAVLNLYADQRITAAEAARMLSISRLQMMDLLGRSGIGFRVDLEEDDFEMLRHWRVMQGPEKVD